MEHQYHSKYGKKKALDQLNTSKSTGSDGLPAVLLKAASKYLAGPLTHLFCLSISERVVPDYWKFADIIPIPKKPSCTLNDLRPISLTPIVAKVLERLILNQTIDLFINNYDSHQFAYRPLSSTTAAVIRLHNDITATLDNPHISAARVIAFDMSKAFDRVDHLTLLKKCNGYNFPIPLIEWIADFLKNRKQCVRLFGTKSSVVNVTSSVPQGCVLAPYLFSIYMSSLDVIYPDTFLYKYADDVSIMCGFLKDNVDQSLIKMQIEVDNIKSWCTTNNLCLNVNKTVSLTINSTKCFIPPFKDSSGASLESPTLRFLGIHFDTKLSWSVHVDYIIKKCSQRLHVIRLLRRYLNQEELLSVYYASIRSIIEYACPGFVGLNNTLSASLEKLQKRCLRIILNDFNLPANFVVPLSKRRTLLALKLFSIIRDNKNHILHDLFPANLPHSGNLQLEHYRSDRRLNSFFPFMSILSNSM